MNWILKLKSWQIFPVLILGLLLNNFTVEGNETLTTTLTLTGGMIYFSWLLFVGHGLYQLLPKRIGLNYNLFIINTGIWLTAYIVVVVISDGEGMSFNGLAALPGFYVAYAFLHFMIFPVRTLKSIEAGRKATVGECIGDFFLVIILPLGIWFLQPRINKVATTPE